MKENIFGKLYKQLDLFGDVLGLVDDASFQKVLDQLHDPGVRKIAEKNFTKFLFDNGIKLPEDFVATLKEDTWLIAKTGNADPCTYTATYDYLKGWSVDVHCMGKS